VDSGRYLGNAAKFWLVFLFQSFETTCTSKWIFHFVPKRLGLSAHLSILVMYFVTLTLCLELPHCMNFRVAISVQPVHRLVSKCFSCFLTHKLYIYIYNFPQRRLVLAVILYKTTLGPCSECKFSMRGFCLLCMLLFNEKREDLCTIMQFWLFDFKITDKHLQRVNVKGNELCAQHNKQRSCSNW
jgi:hypothetical protein